MSIEFSFRMNEPMFRTYQHFRTNCLVDQEELGVNLVSASDPALRKSQIVFNPDEEVIDCLPQFQG